VQTCPLIDYLAWMPLALATTTAAVVASVGILRRSHAIVVRAGTVFLRVILGMSVASGVAILGLEGSC
jgi:hypothetical protein